MSLVNGGGGRSDSNVWGRGHKRAVDESNVNLGDFERFEKRLRMLSLREEKNGKKKLYTPVSKTQGTAALADAAFRDNDRRKNRVNAHGQSEGMEVDDRPDRVFIHDLDAELASDSEPESDSERLIFLPDIEKRFSKIPAHVLNPGSDESQELVLYSVPQSLSVDEGRDSVRKAVIEARARAREKAIEDARLRQEGMERQYDQSGVVDGVESAHGFGSGYVQPGQVPASEDQEPDAMDID